jgi:hypothetical protein
MSSLNCQPPGGVLDPTHEINPGAHGLRFLPDPAISTGRAQASQMGYTHSPARPGR